MNVQAPSQADHIIGRFGGLTPLARALGHKHVSTVQGWRNKGVIPPRRYEEIIAAGAAVGVQIAPADFVLHLTEPRTQEQGPTGGQGR